MENRKLKYMDKFEIYFQNLNKQPEKVIITTKILTTIGCVVIIISDVLAILGKVYSYGIYVFWQELNSNVIHVGEYSTEILITGYINLIVVSIILFRNFRMKSLPSKFGIYGLEFIILGIISMLSGNITSLPIIFIGIWLLMIFQDDTIVMSDNNSLNSLKSYLITYRISVIAVLISIIGVIFFFDEVFNEIYAIMFPFEFLALFLAYYEKRNNPNGLQVLAIILGYGYFVLFLFDFLNFAFTPGRI